MNYNGEKLTRARIYRTFIKINKRQGFFGSTSFALSAWFK